MDRAERRELLAAARLALRGHGGAEPNPLVGCVIASPLGERVGWGCHRHCGGPHAEINALRMAGARARGATVYLTLEPCNHTGRTAPCTEALIEAGVGRVVIARRDPHPQAGGGLERLRDAGIAVHVSEACPEAAAVSDPFVYRIATGLPWVIAKWAQSIDGRIASRAGQSRWISGERSRAMVHRERGRVDAILTGIGTVLADDPLLTARLPGGRRPRRIARRVVIDPELRMPADSRLLGSVHEAPLTVICGEAADAHTTSQLERAGAEVVALPADSCGRLPLGAALRLLADRYEVSTVFLESGPGLLSSLLREALVNEAWAFIGPVLLADDEALPVARGFGPEHPADGIVMSPLSHHRRGNDMLVRYRIATGQNVNRHGAA